MQEGLLALVGRGKRKNKDWPYQVLPCAFNGPANSPQSAATGGREEGTGGSSFPCSLL